MVKGNFLLLAREFLKFKTVLINKSIRKDDKLKHIKSCSKRQMKCLMIQTKKFWFKNLKINFNRDIGYINLINSRLAILQRRKDTSKTMNEMKSILTN